jgi:signal transduction histidine kinase
VPEAERDRIWEPFVRLREDETAGGSGLGLAVVRRVVAAHGGEAWVDDAPGGGARFHLRLALARTAPAPAEGVAALR